MKSIISILLASSTLLFSCNNSSSEKSSVSEETNAEISTDEHQHNQHSEAIALNDGKKWKVADKMIVHIRTMEKDVNDFKGKSASDYKMLSGKIEKNIELLTSGCTMTGQAHDELHKWLLPFIDLTDEFAESEKTEESAIYVDKVKLSFVEFNQYFN